MHTMHDSDKTIQTKAIKVPPLPSDFNQKSRSLFDLPGYNVQRKIGKGAQGNVYLATRKSDGAQVAVKRLSIESVKNWKEYELFQREANVLAGLNIDGVARFYKAIQRLNDTPPFACIVQEYIHGHSLADLLNAGHRFTMYETYGILIQLTRILKQLHTHKPPVIHRDVKPSNIMLSQDASGHYKVYLIDFGAVANPQIQSGGSTVAGTYGYMPPEQLMGRPQPASDIYALAAVAVQMFTGISPSDMPYKDFHLIFEPQMQSMPVALVQTLRDMLDPDASKRFCNYDEIIQRWRNFRQEQYQINNLPRKQISPKEFRHQLLNVQHYGDPGSIELWQELPDITPRKLGHFPKPYKKLQALSHKNAFHSPQKKVFKDSSYDEQGSLSNSNVGCLPIILINLGLLVFCGSAFFLSIAIFRDWNCHIPFGDFTTKCAMDQNVGLFLYSDISIVIFSFMLFIVVNLETDSKSKKTYKRTIMSDPSWGHSITEDAQKRVNNLLRRGTKTIATIVEIQYIEDSESMIEFNKNADQNNPNQQPKEIPCVYHRAPMFIISYKFNPPDDHQSADLIHTIKTHIPPEEHYKVGDPFPILYLVDSGRSSYRQARGFETVTSMPFPLALSDIAENDNVVAFTSHEFAI